LAAISNKTNNLYHGYGIYQHPNSKIPRRTSTFSSARINSDRAKSHEYFQSQNTPERQSAKGSPYQKRVAFTTKPKSEGPTF
jgi:hypothetical protein